MTFYYYTGNPKIGHTFLAIVTAATLEQADTIVMRDYGVDSHTPGVVVTTTPK